MLYLVALCVVTLAVCLVAAIAAVPITVRLVLAHIEETQQVNGTPVQLLREKHEQQFALERAREERRKNLTPEEKLRQQAALAGAALGG